MSTYSAGTYGSGTYGVPLVATPVGGALGRSKRRTRIHDRVGIRLGLIETLGVRSTDVLPVATALIVGGRAQLTDSTAVVLEAADTATVGAGDQCPVTVTRADKFSRVISDDDAVLAVSLWLLRNK